ncbi:hypothetical protein SAY86_008955 [Trapa natans]|uniref:Uncharacterized protein n=1 Tax=Trapa natans TaxID=22666 RepID=A0AAN7QBV3_TRANT|nr:hypothetical protein SAY86_008955 [Trapa natans]
MAGTRETSQEQKRPAYPPPAGVIPAAGIPMSQPAPMYTEMASAPAIQQPSHQLLLENRGPWSVNLFDCFSECGFVAFLTGVRASPSVRSLRS